MKSYFLVGVQFTLIAFLAWYGGVFGDWLSNAVLVVGILLGLWAVVTMRFRVNILPEVRVGQSLMIAGPYRLMRHPMYTAVLLITLAWVQHRTDSISLIVWGMLLADLLAKLQYEESELRAKFPEYEAYAKKTKRLIPGVY